MKKLKIALVFDDTLDKPDGVQQYILALGIWLTHAGHEVHYIVGETRRKDLRHVHSMARNLHVRFNQNRMSMPLPVSRRKVRELLNREQFDILHVQVPYSPYLAARVIAAAPPRTAVIGTFHIAPHSWVVSTANRLLGMWLHRNLRRFDRMLAVSRVAQVFAEKTFKVSSEIVPNTINLAPFFTAKPFEKYQDVPTIVFLGRLVERKGCRYLLKAAADLRKTFKKPFRVVVCGDGPLEHELKLYVNAHGLADVVTFEGFIKRNDKPRYLASADIVTLPSTGGESFGIVILEAMAASKGVVLAGDNPGYAAVLAEHPEALFNPHDTVAFAELLYRRLQDAGARQRAHAWQSGFVKQYDVPVVGAQVLAIYNEALRQRQNV